VHSLLNQELRGVLDVSSVCAGLTIVLGMSISDVFPGSRYLKCWKGPGVQKLIE